MSLPTVFRSRVVEGAFGSRNRRRILALVAFRDEMEHLPGLMQNLAGQVDGVVALDDQSVDDSAAYMATRPEVLTLLRIAPGEQEELEDGRNHRALTKAAWDLRADWLLGLDADERVERDFRQRAEAEITAAEAAGHDAIWVHFRELWAGPLTYRADGIWGRKRKICLFKSSRDHVFHEARVHAVWASVPNLKRDGWPAWPQGDLNLYHLRMIRPDARLARVARYERIDPNHVFQRIGYDYLVDEAGLELKHIPPGREYRPVPEI